MEVDILSRANLDSERQCPSQKLDDLGHRLQALEHALAILGADEATHMAVGGGEARAEAMSSLAGMYHRQATAPEIGDWIGAAEGETLNDEQLAALREFKRQYVNMTACRRNSSSGRRAPACARTAVARPSRQGRLGRLSSGARRVVALAREEAALRAAVLGLDPYDALMDQYDPGNRAADITPVFAAAQELPARFSFLKPLMCRPSGWPPGR